MSAAGQTTISAQPLERTIHASKATVEAALRKLPSAAGGRLPTLDGFVDPKNERLDRFQRPHYTYSIQIVAASAADSVVKISAHVTAWREDPAAGKSGYRVLPSSGRLEADLFEQLEDALSPKVSQNSAVEVSPTKSDSKPKPASPVLFERSGIFAAPRAGAILPPRTDVAAAASGHSSGYEQSLREQEASLEEILRNQTHPADLAAVKRSKTPVYSKPSEQGEVLFLAEAQDEFQVLNTSPDWVHVQVSGLSRAWIRGADLELPGRSVKVGVENGEARASESSPSGEPYRLFRQEVTTFPGGWAALRGKRVRVVTLTPSGSAPVPGTAKWLMAKEMLRRAADRLSGADAANPVDGVVVVFDSADGGMASATVNSLLEWSRGKLSDEAFRAQCSLDPPEAF